MRISKLYIKIFVSVLLGLIFAEALMFGAFRGIYRHGFRRDIGQVVDAHAVLIRSFVQTRLAAGVSIQETAVELAAIVPGDVWALDGRGRVMAASDPNLEIPSLDDFDHERSTREGVRLDFEDDALLALLPIDPGAGDGGERLLFEFRRGDRDGPGESTFALALAGVAVAFAMLLYPLSRLLGRPLRELRASVLRIADGDLDHRVQVRGQDEIGELGRAFNQMADRVERMVDGTRELTAHVSHELRSPLARIRVAAELLRENENAGHASDGARRAAELHDSIHEEIEDLDALIGRILELSRLDLKAAEPPQPRLTEDVLIQLNELAVRYRPAFERRNLDFRIMLPGYAGGSDAHPVPLAAGSGGDSAAGPGSGSGHFARGARNTQVAFAASDLQTALSALLDNAVKYAHSRVILKARLAREPSESPSLYIEVSNPVQGHPGIDAQRIFEPFQRGAAHQDRQGEGLGLAIARKVVQNAGGEISGTVSEKKAFFTIRLPLV